LVLVAPPAIEESLSAAEAALDAGHGLSGTGFWRAVATVKRQPELTDRYADRMAAIDLAAFEQWALFKMPVGWGTALMILATAAGLGLVGWSYYTTGELSSVVLFYLGLGVLLVPTHGLAHLVVGTAMGMRFTHWFIGKISQPQPGVKVDYSTYLRTPASRRAWMHASGAITTKVTPFALIGAAVAADLPSWAVWGVPVVGVAAIVTDILWSTKHSDWMKFRREMEFAQTP
jgi:hypothetical protein